MRTDQNAAGDVPQAIRARYAVLQHIAGGASGYAHERAAAANVARQLAQQYPSLLTATTDDGTIEVLDLASDEAWAWGRLDVPGTAGLGRTRTDALTQIIRAHNVDTVRVDWRRPNSETRLSYFGMRPIIEHLDVTLPAILAGLDAAALTATRRYRQWIRERDDNDPAWHSSMCRHWRRDYLTAAGAAYAGQLRDAAYPPMLTTTSHHQNSPAMGHYNAFELADHDAQRLDPKPLRTAHAVIKAAHLAVRNASRCELDRVARAQITDHLSRLTIGARP